ncbi:MAG: patatin-like phospholipase family protein [Acholeplasmataceae bacterium]|nr:patatin-like phospholipase family protein [Acholeplasmataceae bacterium]
MEVKIGLALGGGGARGSYQIGVLEAFRKYGLLKQIKHVSGTSIGAINTMMVMAGFSYERMLEVWENMHNKDIYGKGLDRFKLDKQGLFSLQDVFNKMTEEIKLSEIRESKIHGYATAAKIKKGSFIDQVLIHRMEKEVFYLNEFKDPLKAVLASASIPVLFGSTNIDDEFYVDGGTLDNCPVQPLIDAGCNVIFAIPIDGIFFHKKYNSNPILLVNFKTHYLFSRTHYDVLDFNTDDIRNKALYGEKMGEAIMNKLIELGMYKKDGTWEIDDEFQYVSMEKSDEKNLKTEVEALWT